LTIGRSKTGDIEKNVFVGLVDFGLSAAKVQREAMVDTAGLSFIRRKFDGGWHYFIANRGEQRVDGWIPLATPAKSVVLMDALSGRTGVAESRQSAANKTEVYLQLAPGESVIVRAFDHEQEASAKWPNWNFAVMGTQLIKGAWRVEFISGGPTLPASFTADHLESWTALGGTNAGSFAGTARYTTTFDAPWRTATTCVSLGNVAQSARVKLNGKDYGTLLTPPFRVFADNLTATNNVLEVEVTSTSANRIRDLDRRGVKWQNFHDINFVNQNYKPFDASDWPPADCGLLGPVTLQPVDLLNPAMEAAK
jgi:hypothetical protein